MAPFDIDHMHTASMQDVHSKLKQVYKELRRMDMESGGRLTGERCCIYLLVIPCMASSHCKQVLSLWLVQPRLIFCSCTCPLPDGSPAVGYRHSLASL